MTHTYNISGMTCGKCAVKVKSELLRLPEVESAEVSYPGDKAVITMNKHIELSILQKAIDFAGPAYVITEQGNHRHEMTKENATSFITTYKPIILIFLYITVTTFAVQLMSGSFNSMQWMQHFMAGFFLVFSFFKLLNIKDFAEAYKTYDLPAKYIPGYAQVYPFIEFTLGMAYLINFNPVFTNLITVIVMGASSAGVIQSLLNRQKIQCACLGVVFNLPMSTITLLEDVLMIFMSSAMLYILL